jgi:hypothetical protein
MPVKVPLLPFLRRRSRRALASSPAPVLTNQITSVVYGPAPESLTVTVSGTLVDIADVTGSLAIEIDESTYNPIDADLSELPQVVLTFERDVTTATAWTVPSPAAWDFSGGEPLVAPFSGSIE